jgi:SAM-dependent methyltransferase
MKRQLKQLLFPTLNIRSVTRISLDRTLLPLLSRLQPGVVLDVGAKYSPYRKHIPFTDYMTLDSDVDTKPDICSDLHHIKWKDNYFDTVVATEVLEHLYDPGLAVNEIHRILKPGGVCIASTRFIYVYHPDPHDYYRFTWDSLNYLFRDYTKVEIFHHGNRLQSIWQLINTNYDRWRVFLNILNPLIGRTHFKKTAFPCGFVVYAQK